MKKSINIPKWVFEGEDFVCERCEVEFDSSNFTEDSIVVVKNDESPPQYFCNSCFEFTKNNKFESEFLEFKEWLNILFFKLDEYSKFTDSWLDTWIFRLEEIKGVQYKLIQMNEDIKDVLKIMSPVIPDYSLFEEIQIQLDKVISKIEGCC